jgi:hypothetical protein
MGTILVPLFTHYRPAPPLVQAAYAEGLRGLRRASVNSERTLGFMVQSAGSAMFLSCVAPRSLTLRSSRDFTCQ